MIHGRNDEAEEIVREIEQRVEREAGEELDELGDAIEIQPRKSTGFVEIARTMVKDYPSRSVLGFSLMAAQAFFYNAVFFTYAIILSEFMRVDPGRVPLYLIPFALGNFLGPLLLGRLFDVVGRRTMIAGSYIVSGIGLAAIAYLFSQDVFGAGSLTLAYAIVFFVASAGASAAYLTVSEIFPLETRAMAIAFFYAVATGAGGISGPIIYGALVGTGDPTMLAWGFVGAAVLMIAAGIVEVVIGVPAEQESLEDVAEPLSAEGGGEPEREREPGRGPTAVMNGRRDRTFWSSYPAFTSTAYDDEATLLREVDLIVHTLGEQGALSRRALAGRLHASLWGPGQFGRALGDALASGRVRRDGRLYRAQATAAGIA